MPAKPVRSLKIYSMTAAILAWPRGVGLLRGSLRMGHDAVVSAHVPLPPRTA